MDDEQSMRGRRWIVGLTLMAAERSQELFAVCAATQGDEKDLLRAVADAFGITELDADVILSMPVRRFSPASVRRLRAEFDDLERHLALAGA